MDPFAGWFIVEMSRREAREAMPDAPIRPDRRGEWRAAVRRRSAAGLRRLADHLEPRCRPPAGVSAAGR